LHFFIAKKCELWYNDIYMQCGEKQDFCNQDLCGQSTRKHCTPQGYQASSAIYDLVVVGAGPAGLMAAGCAAARGLGVAVLEGNAKCGKKLYITGKGRCNLTNDTNAQGVLDNVVSNPKFLYGALHKFAPKDTIDFFESRGLPLVVERGGRVFPFSQKASDVTSVLQQNAQKGGVKFFLETKVTGVQCCEQGASSKFVVKSSGRQFFANSVLIATGGKSYAMTGSDGSGWALAKNLGHNLVAPMPALVAIEFVQDTKPLQGLSLRNINCKILHKAKVVKEIFGEMVFTDKGASGPIILSASSLINRWSLADTRLQLDLKPGLSFEKLDERVLRDFALYQNKDFINALDDLLPTKLIPYIVQKVGIAPHKKVNTIARQERQNFVNMLKKLEFEPSKLGGIDFGIVTAGGVDTKQIDPKTMQSKIVPGLYFAGECIDVDALTGGYNVQIALSTGHLVGNSVGENI